MHSIRHAAAPLTRRWIAGLVVTVAFPALAAAQSNPQLLWSTGWSNWTAVPSYLYGSPTIDTEAADDFDLNGTITRMVFNGNPCFGCATPTVLGAFIRFYDGAGGVIGALQSEQYLPAGSPGLLFTPSQPGTFDITLPTPFAAAGRHFVSVQVAFQGAGYWAMWVANNNNPTLSPLRIRDRLAGTPWTGYAPLVGWPAVAADLSLELWGDPPAPPPPPSLDPAATWQILNTPNLAGGPRAWLRDLKILALDDVWAVGDASVPVAGSTDNICLSMHWDGSQWNIVPIPSPSPAPGMSSSYLYAMDGTGPNDLWAAGTQNMQVAGGWVGQQVLIEHWDGQQWSVMSNTPLPATSGGAGVSGATVYDAVAITPNDAWFVGRWIELYPNSTTSRPGLLTHWDGSSFTQYNVPVVATYGQQSFGAVAASGSNDVWAVGGSDTSAASTVPVVFHWDGSSWTHRPPPTTGGQRITFTDVVAIDPQNAWLSGYYSSSTPGSITPVIFYWNAGNWTQLSGPPSGGRLQVYAPNLIYAVGSSVQRFDGTSWTTVASFPSITSAQGIAVGSYGLYEMWTVGGEWIGGTPAPFSARVDGPRYARTTQRPACSLFAAPGSLQALSPPRPGSVFTAGISDPAGYLGTPGGIASSWWFVSLGTAPGSPCGISVGPGGVLGSPGAILIDPATIVLTLGPVSVPGPGTNAVHAVAIPALPYIAGANVFTQGLIVDPANPAHVLLTNALDVRIGY